MGSTIIDIHDKALQAFVEKNRPPVNIRGQLDLGYTYEKGIIELSEIRPNGIILK